MPAAVLTRRRPLTRYEDGIHLNFKTGRHYVKALGAPAQIAPLTSLFTFTGDALSMYRGASGLLVPSQTNTPRIEYDAGGNALGLLIEATRTNLCLRSQELNTDGAGAPWLNVRATVSANAATGPDGAASLEKVIDDNTASNTHLVRQTFTKAASAIQYTWSAWVKGGERTFCHLRLINSGGTVGAAVGVDLSAGTIGAPYGIGGSPFTSISATITPYANDIYRVALTATSDTDTSVVAQITGATSTDVLGTSYSGDGASGFYAGFCQLEAAAFPSSYIPTTTASVARAADVCTRTLGAEFSATVGTAVVAGRTGGGQDAATMQAVYSFDDGTTNERICCVRVAISDSYSHRDVDGGVLQTSLDFAVSNNAAFKSAHAWAVNDFAATLDGAAVLTDGAATLPTMTTLQLGGIAGASQGNCHIRTFDYWPERKSNAFLRQAAT